MNLKEQIRSTLSDVLKIAFKDFRKTIYTAMPGIIEAYDPATKRASIQPALRTAFRDGEYGSLPILPNVPVVLPSGGGFSISFPLQKGDPVLIVFCQRGISLFKKTFVLSNPSGGILAADAPVAYPGFGPLEINAGSGLSLQQDDGTNKIEITESNVKVSLGETGGGTFYPDGEVEFVNGSKSTSDGDFETSDGISLRAHVHPILGGSSAPGPTGAPQ